MMYKTIYLEIKCMVKYLLIIKFEGTLKLLRYSEYTQLGN